MLKKFEQWCLSNKQNGVSEFAQKNRNKVKPFEEKREKFEKKE